MSRTHERRMVWFVGMSLLNVACAAQPPLSLWYDKPATRFTSALPLGNGRMGCMAFGGTVNGHLQFNVDSLWTGDENPSGNYGRMGAYQNFGDLYIELQNEPQNVTRYRRELNLNWATAQVSYQTGQTTYRRQVLASHPDQVIAWQRTKKISRTPSLKRCCSSMVATC